MSFASFARCFLISAAFTCIAIDLAQAENGCPAGYEPWKIPIESPSDCMAIPDYNAPDMPEVPQQHRVSPPQWIEFAAAVAWADSDRGNEYTGVEKYFDEQSAREAALKKCRAKGWRNCKVATSTINGVIVVARDNTQALRTRIDATEEAARVATLAKCKIDAVSCQILAVYDARPEYF